VTGAAETELQSGQLSSPVIKMEVEKGEGRMVVLIMAIIISEQYSLITATLF